MKIIYLKTVNIKPSLTDSQRKTYCDLVISQMRFSLFQNKNLTHKELIQETKKELSSLAKQAATNEDLALNKPSIFNFIFHKLHAMEAEERAQNQNQQQELHTEIVRERLVHNSSNKFLTQILCLLIN